MNKLVYQIYYSPDGSMNGYTDFTLSYMDIASFNISEKDKKLLKGAQYCRFVYVLFRHFVEFQRINEVTCNSVTSIGH